MAVYNPSMATKRHFPFPFDDYDKIYNHNKLSASGITYYARQNGKAWKADLGGFVSNCPVSHVHEIMTTVISNLCHHRYGYIISRIHDMYSCNRVGKINPMARVIPCRGEGDSKHYCGGGEGNSQKMARIIRTNGDGNS